MSSVAKHAALNVDISQIAVAFGALGMFLLERDV